MIQSREAGLHAGGWFPCVRVTSALERLYVRLPAAEPLATPVGKKRGQERVNTMRSRTVRAFSLVELIAVISIIALLLSLTGIGAVGWINSAKARGTMTTMNTLKTAIDVFVNERPMASGWGDPRIPPKPNREWRLPNPDGRLGYEAYFGAFPPTPIAQINTNNTAAPLLDEDTPAEAKVISKQFSYMVMAYLQGSGMQAARMALDPNGRPEWLSPGNDPTSEDYASIECLVLFLSQMSPRSKGVIDKMPTECKKNLDRDVAMLAGGQQFALIEITDAWGKPLRWAVQPVTSDLVRWELRSAGKDGVFASPFAATEQSDDVVLPGP